MSTTARRLTTSGAPTPARNRARALVALAVLAVLVAVLALTVSHASAHANVASADPVPDSALPASPPRVTITFTEPLAPSLSGIEVLDTAGKRVDGGDSAVDPANAQRMTVSLPALPDGTYTVFWHNVSTVDGHALRGTYVFYVGTKPANAPASSASAPPLFPSPAEPVVRWLVLSGLLAAVGALVFQLTVAWPATGGRDGKARAALGAAIERRTRRIVVAALGLLVVASLAHIVVEAMSAYQVSAFAAPGKLGAVIGGTQWGRMWAGRMVLLAAACGIVAAWVRQPLEAVRRAPGLPARRLVVAALLVLAGAMLTLSFASHAAVTPNVAPAAVMTDFFHLLAAGAWAGGLVAMAAAVLAARAVSDPDARRSAIGALASRFSAIGVLGTGTLFVTGAYSAWAQVSTFSALNTAYGRTVVFKSIAFVVLIALAAVNMRVLRPRLARSDGAGRWLSRLVVAEVAVAVLVVVAAGVLTSIEPARQVASREAAAHGIQLEQQVDTTHVAVAVQPGTTGTNRIVVDLTDQRGRPVTNATVVSLRVQFAGADLGATSVTAQHTTGNEYVADGVLLSLVGRWQIEALVTRPDALDARAAWRFDVAAPGTGGGARFEPSTTAGDLAWAWEVILLGGLLLAVTNTWWERDRIARSLNVFGGVAVLAGVVMWFGLPHAHVGPPPVTGVVNPIAPTEASIAAGKTVYQTNCVTCHGVSGAGDGPDAAGLDPPPADLITHVPLHSDGDLFSFIANGFPRTAMPAWKGTLTDEQMWNVVNYLRTLGAGPPTAVTPTGTGTGTASPPAASATATPTPAGTRP